LGAQDAAGSTPAVRTKTWSRRELLPHESDSDVKLRRVGVCWLGVCWLPGNAGSRQSAGRRSITCPGTGARRTLGWWPRSTVGSWARRGHL